MASRRRSLEEKNLKILRELAAYPANKQCFDCHQRGPTYINMTTGSFVCTSCSGLLRGLTPPHRVKSITMTMFTQEEIEFLKTRGNEYCKYVWLGTYVSRTSDIENEGKDDHRKRDFMVQKYEKKRWYVDPEIAVKKMQQEQQKQVTNTSVANNARQLNRVPEVQPISQLFGKSPVPLVVESSQASDKWPQPVSSASAPHVATTKTSQSQGGFQLLAEFGGDTLVSPSSEQTGTMSANGNFANFESAFNSFPTPERRMLSSSHSSNNTRKTCTPQMGWTSFDDDLDPLSPTASSSSHSVSSASAVTRVQTCTTVMPRPLSLPTFAPTNPFKSFPVTNLVNNSTQWMSFPVSSGTAMIIPASASLDSYPALSLASKKDNAICPPPLPSLPPTSGISSTESERMRQDRYAALADLDSSFHQPTSVTSPSWTVKSVATTTNTTATTTTVASVFNFPSTEASSNLLFGTATSNPFATTSSVLWSQPTQKPITSANPFLTDTSLPYQQSQMKSNFSPLPVVGNSPSDDTILAHYNVTSSAPFAAFTSGGVSSPPNGYNAGQFIMQNGDFANSGHSPWGMSPSTSMPLTLSNSHMQVNSTIGMSEKRPSEFPQCSLWPPNSANPFIGGPGSVQIPSTLKSNSSNPFL